MDGFYVLFLLYALTAVALPTFADVCEEALGKMAVKDSLKENLVTSPSLAEKQGVIQLDTSLNSFLSQKYWKTRLTEPTSTEQNEVMQFDMGKPSLIRAIVARGCGEETDCTHVTRYRLLYSLDKIKWHYYSTSRNEGDAVFIRDNDCSSSTRFDFTCPFIARYIRILPHSWRLPCNLMVELIGCALETHGGRIKEESPVIHSTLNPEREGGGYLGTSVPDNEATALITSTETEDYIATVTPTSGNLDTISSDETSQTDVQQSDSQKTTETQTLPDSQGETDLELTSASQKTSTVKAPSYSQSTGGVKILSDIQTTAEVRAPWYGRSETEIKTLSEGQSKSEEKVPAINQTITTEQLPLSSSGTVDLKPPTQRTSEQSTRETETTTEPEPVETTVREYVRTTGDHETTVREDVRTTGDHETPGGMTERAKEQTDHETTHGMTERAKEQTDHETPHDMTERVKEQTDHETPHDMTERVKGQTDHETPHGMTERVNEHTDHTIGNNVSYHVSTNLTTLSVLQDNGRTLGYPTSDSSSRDSSPSIDTLGLSSTKGSKDTSPHTTDANNLVSPVGCVVDCDGKPNGHYHSCKNCKVFVTCSNGILFDNRPCPSSLTWDDHRKQCAYSSQTCGLIRVEQISRS